MPVIEVTLVAGRSPDQLRALIQSVTSAVETSIGAPRESVRVVVREVAATHFAVGGTPLAETRRYQQRRPAAGEPPARARPEAVGE